MRPMIQIPPGRSVQVRVPATSANLGPGFDCLGLALSWYDEIRISTIPKPENGIASVEVSGEGADVLPRDESHLIVATVLDSLTALNAEVSGLHLSAHNTIPHGRGLGSSAAATVAGLVAAWSLVHPNNELPSDWLLDRACAIEGHADNVSPAILGGLTVSWHDPGSASPFKACNAQINEDVRAVAFVPSASLLTKTARGVLPARVDLADATYNISRAALLVHALSSDLRLLHEATADRLHQEARGDLMPESLELVQRLRNGGYAAFISGAGPTVMVLCPSTDSTKVVQAGTKISSGFEAHVLTVGTAASCF